MSTDTVRATVQATVQESEADHDLVAVAIDPAHLERIRTSGRDDGGHRPQSWPEADGVPLRCCLRRARPEDDVVLISYAPLRTPSAWQELGPVFVHAGACEGWHGAGLPEELRAGPRVLRGYRDDGSLDYASVRVVEPGEDVAPVLGEIFDAHDVTEVHARALAEQCFTYAVRRGPHR